MNIEILGGHSLQKAKEVWDISRPGSGGETPMEKVIEVDAPVNEFPDVILCITSTIIEREIIASMRDHTMWAQTSRVENPLEFRVEDSLMSEYVRDQRINMRARAAQGMNQDHYRLQTPLVAETTYCVKINLRSLVKLKQYFERLGFESSSDCLGQVLNHMDAGHLIYHEVDLLHQVVYSDMSGMAGSCVSLSIKAPFSLRTHLIRHRNLFVRDEMLHWIISGSWMKLCLADEMHLTISADESVWRDIASKRSCWLAHYGLWGPLLRELNDVTGLDTGMLPCSEGKCLYVGDNDLRIAGKDPNPPCPRYYQLKDMKVPKEVAVEMELMSAADHRLPFWDNIIEEVTE